MVPAPRLNSEVQGKVTNFKFCKLEYNRNIYKCSGFDKDSVDCGGQYMMAIKNKFLLCAILA